MAEAVLFNVAESILKKLRSQALNEFWLLRGLQGDIEKLKNTVETISAVLLDAESQYLTNNEVRVWLDSLKDVVYDADDLLDDISTEELKRQLRSGVVTKVKLRFSFSNWSTYGLKLAHKIKDARAKLQEIAENRKFLLNPNVVQPTVPDHDRDTHSTAPNKIIGREDDKKKMISSLLGNHEQNVVVLPIVGFGGLGKTTLAQIVYNDETVKGNFDLRAWVCVSDIFDVKSIVGKMIQCIDSGAPVTNLDLEPLRIQLYKIVERKKCLIVLDDVWNEEREKWVQFRDLIKGSGCSGCRIIVTTRSQVVADITNTSSTYVLKGLSELESWDLFREAAFKQGQEPNEEFEKMGKKIATKCGGLPLAIRTIGSLLYTKTESEWLHFKDVEFAKLDPKVDIVKTLKLSYNHLPPNLKHCFAYCSLFPKDSMFDEDTLTKSWRAQGYVGSENEGTSFQVSGHDCLKYLVQRSFFQMERQLEFEERVVYKMHDFMHDLATSVAGAEVKLLIPGNGNEESVTGKTRHISLYEVPHEIAWKHVAPLLNAKKARTLIVEPQSMGKLNVGKEVLNVLAELKYLRVLKISGCQLKILPNFICKLKHLRELDLSKNYEIKMLPDSVTRLCNLEVLNLDECYSLKELPKNMKMLVKLIELRISGCRKCKSLPPLYELPSLQLLYLGYLDGLEYMMDGNGSTKGSGMPCFFPVLKDLRIYECPELKGWWSVTSPAAEPLQYQMPCLSDLFIHNCPKLEGWMPRLPSIKKLTLDSTGLGMMEETLKQSKPLSTGLGWMLSLKNLVELRISFCEKFKSLPPLYGLPSLQLLEFRDLDGLEYMMDGNGSTKGSGMPCFFPVLKDLYIYNCPELKGWWSVTSPAAEPLQYQMPCLSNLSIYDCPKLEGWMPRLPSIKTVSLERIGLGLLEETLKQSKPLSTGTSCGTTISSLESLIVEGIEDLEILQEEEVLRSLASLKFLEISDLKDAKFLSIWSIYLTSLESLLLENVKEMNLLEENNSELIQCLNNLRSLSISYCLEMKALPEWIQHLTSLEKLQIEFCEELESLPLAMGSLTSLNSLLIRGCSHLSERCGSNQGEDWPAISHIPNIYVDKGWVQRDGRYKR